MKHALSKQLNKTNMAVRDSSGENMMLPGDPWVPAMPKQIVSAYAPFPRSTWIHPRVPTDNFDRVCKNIWRRSKEARGGLGGGQCAPARPQNRGYTSPGR